MKNLMVLAALAFAFSACEKDPALTATDKKLFFQFAFDAQQARLNNIGQPAPVAAGNAAQTPTFRKMSVHYVELAPSALTPLGAGAVVFKGAETAAGGAAAVDFDKAAVAAAGQIFATIDLKNVPPGAYEWVRASVTYQNYDVLFNVKKAPFLGDVDGQSGTVASFVGFNTFIKNVTPRERVLTVNDDKKQGFWAFETNLTGQFAQFNNLYSGEAPAGATTVVNPLFATSPIPAGSCVVTGRFAQPLVVTGTETADVTVELSFSIQNSFEWEDPNGNGQLDFYADGSTQNERIVDMGLRGLVPKVK